MKPLALAVLSAVLSVLVFPRFDLNFLAPLCLAPLFVAAAWEANPKRRLLIGWAAGFVYWFGICHWIAEVLHNYGGMNVPLVALAFFLFCVLKAMNWAAFTWLAGYLVHSRWAVLLLAALWTGQERIYGPFGFAWFALGNAGIDMGVPMRLAPLTGVYGLSFVFAMMNAAVALLVLRRPRLELAPLALLPLLYFLPALPPIEQGQDNAVLVQPNIRERQDWTSAQTETTIRGMMLQALDVSAPRQPNSMILFPEVPAPFYENDPKLRDQAAQLARVLGTPVLMGVVSHSPKGPRNSVIQVSPDGSFGPRYDKMNLVPFGEYVPEAFDWIGKISEEAGSFQPGEKTVVFAVNGGRAGVYICYESVLPHFVRGIVASGAQVLVNLSNDGYFGQSAAREQHLLLARMRAAENRRWLLRATNDGVTVTVDPAGRIDRRLTPLRKAAARARFTYQHTTTPYTDNGDWFVWGCLAIGLTAAATKAYSARP
ncbi:MAG: apolipoprotein N-acyltransferase [Acidobacteria bacterium]|nr:apolipoprotein N-acyltransferase [Acidobacteriota bacterium]